MLVLLLPQLACDGAPDGVDTGDSKPAAVDSESGADTEDSGADTGDSPVDTSPADRDGDGYDADLDCDDTDPKIHPNQADACDGVDANCDGFAVDEGGCAGTTELETTAHVEFLPSTHSASLDCLWDTSEGTVLVDRGYSEFSTYAGGTSTGGTAPPSTT